MKRLIDQSEDVKDVIKVKVGTSFLNLEFRTFKKGLIPLYNSLLGVVGSKYQEELKPFIYCSCSALKTLDTGLWISRDNKFYANFNKTNPKFKTFSWRKFKNLLDKMEELGYIENYSGYNLRKEDDSMSSCIVFTDKLISLIREYNGTTYVKDIKQDCKRAVVMSEEKDSDGNRKELRNIQGIGKYEQEIQEIEDWLNTHKFSFLGETKTIQLQRQFIGDLQTAGRVYFGGMQCIKSEKRRLIEINDQQVTELDYVSNHMLIAATLQGIKLPEGFLPYELYLDDLIITDDKSKIRKIAKSVCMYLLNSGTPEATFKKQWKLQISNITKHMEDEDYRKAEDNIFYGVGGLNSTKEVVRCIEDHNSYAKPYFRKAGGCWGEMQYYDSCVLLEVMKKLMRGNIPFLPYHDSVIVPKGKEHYLEIAMTDAWKEVLDSNINCKISKEF